MLSKVRYILLLSAFGVSLSALQSCREEIQYEEPSDKISFNVMSDTDAETRSSEDAGNITLDLGGNALRLSLVTEDNDDMFCFDGVQTRGSAFDNDSHQISSINVTALVENGEGGSPYFTEDVTISGGKGSSNRFWPEKKLSFFAYTVSKDNVSVEPVFVREDGECKGSFDYALPAAQTVSPVKDATNQPDVVFAINPDQSKTDGGAVDLVFHHALSAIIFKVGEMPENVFLTSIAIDGVYSSGTCSMSAAGDSNVDFVWSYTDAQSQNAKYTEEIGNYAVKGDQMGGGEAMFMMLPQTMGTGTKIVLTFSIGGKDYTMEKAFKEILTKWDADKKYIFSIGINSNIDVEVEDMVEGKVKKELTIQNTGTEAGYIRAAIVGYWVNNAGDVVLPWSESDGEFVWGSNWASNWKKGNDGFYYHIKPVASNAFTYPLFETYTLHTSTEIGTSHAFYTLELSIITQIISVDNKDQWPEL
jgi:hypothetical protein